MHRREVCLGIITLLTPTTGCIETVQETTGVTPTGDTPSETLEETTTTTPTVHPDAEEHIEQATDHINTALIELDTVTDRLSSFRETLPYSPETVNLALDRAETELATATSLTNHDGQLRDISYLESWISLIRNTAAVYTELVTITSNFELVDSYLDANRPNDALEELDTASNARSAAAEAITPAYDSLQAITADVDSLELELSLVEYRQVLDRLNIFINTLEFVIPGYRALIKGDRALSNGFDEYDAENYTEAKGLFNEAFVQYAEARSSFRKSEDEADTDLRQTLIAITCQAEKYRDAAEYAFDAADAYEDGDSEAGSLAIDRYDEAVNRTCG